MWATAQQEQGSTSYLFAVLHTMKNSHTLSRWCVKRQGVGVLGALLLALKCCCACVVRQPVCQVALC